MNNTKSFMPARFGKALRAHILQLLVLASLSVSNALAEQAASGHYNNGLGLTPPMGWSSWTFLRKNISEDIIKAQALSLSNTLMSHGYVYVNIDDGWQLDPTQAGNCDAFGRFATDSAKFPNGMKALGDYIHGLGLKFGIYATAGVPVSAYNLNSPILGTSYHVQDIVQMPLVNSLPWAWQYRIDFSKPGAREYNDSWANLFASWGVDYVKLDFINVGFPGTADHGTTDHAQDLSRALLNCGRPIFFQISNNLQLVPPFGSYWPPISNAWRGNPDIERDNVSPTGSYPITDWAHMWDAQRTTLMLTYNNPALASNLAGPGGWNDLDSLIVGYGDASKTGLTPGEKQIHLAYWAMMCSSLLLGTDMTNMDPGDLAMLQNDEIIAIDQTPVPATWNNVNSTWLLWYKPMADGGYAVLMANTGSSQEVKSLGVSWGADGSGATYNFSLPLSGPQKVRDVFARADLGTFDSGFSSTLANHTCMLLKVGGTGATQGISIQPASLANGTVGVPYSQTFGASGGTPGYTWSVTGGTLPGGLALNAGVLAGTPSAAGTFTFTVAATDNAAAIASRTYSLSIAPAALPLTITTPSPLMGGTVGAAYAQTLGASGGTPGYTWSVTGGTLPGGLALNGGVLVGTPSAAGTFTFTVAVTDGAAATTSQDYSLSIAAALVPVISSAATLSGTVGVPLSYAIVASHAPTSFGATGLTAGLTLNAATGVISGTPQSAGTFTLTITATNAAGSASAPVVLTVAAPASGQAPASTGDGGTGHRCGAGAGFALLALALLVGAIPLRRPWRGAAQAWD